jgi:membrane protein YqaA with SNARE-associated domain
MVENIQVIRGLYDWTMKLAEHRNALAALALVAFIESSVFPIPPDILIIPMVLAAREKAWRIALICTVASVLGGIAGYGIGFFLYESIGKALLDFYGYADKFSQFQSYYHEWGAWIVGGAGLTPFPYKVITIASGVADLNLVVFIIASVLSRGLRFFLVAGLLWYFGEPIRVFIEKNLGILATAFFLLLFGGFVLIKFLH